MSAFEEKNMPHCSHTRKQDYTLRNIRNNAEKMKCSYGTDVGAKTS